MESANAPVGVRDDEKERKFPGDLAEDRELLEYGCILLFGAVSCAILWSGEYFHVLSNTRLCGCTGSIWARRFIIAFLADLDRYTTLLHECASEAGKKIGCSIASSCILISAKTRMGECV
jgi:hypothetical protein